MFRNLSSQLLASATGANAADAQKVLSPSLRPDIYNLIDTTKGWLVGGQAGDGVSYTPLLTVIQKHVPGTKKPGSSLLDASSGASSGAEGEIAVVVGGVTNMILELSRWEGLAAGMAMRTWVDALVEARSRATISESRREAIGRGITRGLNHHTDVALLTKDFTTRIQIISSLKTALGYMVPEPTKQGKVKLCGARSSFEGAFVIMLRSQD